LSLCLSSLGEGELGFPISAEASSFLDKRCRYRKQSFRKVLPDATDLALSLVEQLLTVNPSTRPSATAALTHPFLADAEILNDYSKSYLTRPTVNYFNFEHEKFSVEELKAMIDNEVFSSAANAYHYQTVNKDKGNIPVSIPQSASIPIPASSAVGNKPANGMSAPEYGGSYTSQQPGGVPPPYGQGSSYHATSMRDLHNDENSNPSRGGGVAGAAADSLNPHKDGPASQLATQMKNTRLDKAKDNPFANVGGSRVPQQGNAQLQQQTRTVGTTGGESCSSLVFFSFFLSFFLGSYSSSDSQDDTKQQLQKFLKTESSDSGGGSGKGPSGSILTAVRNDMGPPGTRGRKSVPKTPSPQKMDLILQKDYQNKQRLSGGRNGEYAGVASGGG
jgi:serine/threonine protein kinase